MNKDIPTYAKHCKALNDRLDCNSLRSSVEREEVKSEFVKILKLMPLFFGSGLLAGIAKCL